MLRRWKSSIVGAGVEELYPGRSGALYTVAHGRGRGEYAEARVRPHAFWL